jgi:crotonobetainyl-CoA:carnitine CoA-transferase CaiB-like acyl-CoA transferase
MLCGPAKIPLSGRIRHMPAPLSHIRVLDLSRILAGPFCTQILSDLGAEVIKVERPGEGDDTRKWGPPWVPDEDGNDTTDSAYYLACNRGKKSITVDMSTPEGQQMIRDLAAKCDVLVENYKVGGLKKYGLTYDDLKADNPGLIYCSITGFGQTGPYAPRAGYDYMIQAMSGLMSVTGEEDGKPGGGPMRAGVSIADITTGLYSTIAINAAIAHRERTGDGQHIDMALLDCATSILANQALTYFNTGVAPVRVGNRHPSVVPYQPFQTSDGYLIIAVGNDGQFARLCGVLGIPEVAEDDRYAKGSGRIQRQPELSEMIGAFIIEKSTEDWLQILNDVSVPCGPINNVEDVFNDPQIQHRNMRISQPHSKAGSVDLLGSPINLSATPVDYQGGPPTMGENTDDVLRDILDLDDAAIAALRDKSVI